ncbi:MAG: hypothetical protein JWO19_4920 [Bryobacterales bacterium]|nr:hypothetical protein [Bryobacterales bacterium]
MTDAQQIGGSNQWQPQQFRISLNSSQELRVGELEILQTSINVRLAVGVEQSGQTEALNKPLDFPRRHGLHLQVHHLNHSTALLEESLSGAGRLRIFEAEDLNSQQADLRVSDTLARAAVALAVRLGERTHFDFRLRVGEGPELSRYAASYGSRLAARLEAREIRAVTPCKRPAQPPTC